MLYHYHFRIYENDVQFITDEILLEFKKALGIEDIPITDDEIETCKKI